MTTAAEIRAGAEALARVAKAGITFRDAMTNVAKQARTTSRSFARLAASIAALSRLGDHGTPGDRRRLTEAILRRDRIANVTMSDGVCRVVCRPRPGRWAS